MTASGDVVLNGNLPSIPQDGAYTKQGEDGASKPQPQEQTDGLNIIDIRSSKIEHSLRTELLDKLQPSPGQEKQMPTMLLYDERGLKLFEEITYLGEYYLTNAELEVLRENAEAIAQRIRPGSVMLELGSGNLRKVRILLDAMERVGLDVEYYALDLSLSELQRTLSEILPGTYTHVKCSGLHGTYDDGLTWIRSPTNRSRSKCILSLGSSIGNFTRAAATEFLRQWSDVLGPHDSVVIGLDACKDKDKVFPAYNDRLGLTHEFLRNGLRNANLVMGETIFKDEDWLVIGEYDEHAGRHQAFYSPRNDLSFDKVSIQAGERIRVEESYKYSAVDRARLWSSARLAIGAEWPNGRGDYHIHMLYKPAFSLSLDPNAFASNPVPTLTEWKTLWTAWDVVTTQMLPETELLSKPITLRNPCIFYIGHIPTFADMQLASATDGTLVVLDHYRNIFERGVDPEVEHPELCHSHSEIPSSWPNMSEVTDMQTKVRNRIYGIYTDNLADGSSALRRALWLAFEHEAMHLETVLYSLLQHEKLLSPPDSIRPDFEAIAREAEVEALENQWFTIPESNVKIGHRDPEGDSKPTSYFGWDNEKPPRLVKVHSFQARGRPITVGEYALYLERTNNTSIPASWAMRPDYKGQLVMNSTTFEAQNGLLKTVSRGFIDGKLARTVYGPIPLAHALHWPVMASYNELANYASWVKGRIPTLEEVRSIYQCVDQSKGQEATKVLSKTISAVNGHLSNNGVQEAPPPSSGPDPHELFADLQGCNVGYTHWHPVPVTQNGNRLCGRGDLGGVWEWTSTVLETHEGFQPMESYPAYTADFFDGKHNIIQGGSWATHPRIAGRRSFINWFQRSYPYAWAGARLVRDL